MPDREWKFRIEDMLEAIGRIEVFVSRMEWEEFSQDQKTSAAVIRNLEIVGEAARHVPDDVTGRYPEIPWKKAREMRNVLIHAYFGVDLHTVWRTLKEDLPPLKEQLLCVLKDADTG